MPQADLRYSADLNLDPGVILAAVEATILEADPGAGKCKGRAYPAPVFHHTHMILDVVMLPKPHRDPAFIEALIAELEKAVKAHLSQPCEFALKIRFSPANGYITNHFQPE